MNRHGADRGLSQFSRPSDVAIRTHVAAAKMGLSPLRRVKAYASHRHPIIRQAGGGLFPSAAARHCRQK